MKYLQEEGSKSDEEDRKSSLEAMEKTNVDLELWKESSENLFNNVLVKRKTGKQLFCLPKREGAEFSSVAKIADEDVKRFSRTRRQKDVVLPSSINATNLQKLFLRNCSRVVELPAIENATNLQVLDLHNCSSLLELPPSIVSATNLKKLDISGCSQLKCFPEISTNIEILNLIETAIKEVPLSIMSWSRLSYFEMSYFESLNEFPHALDIITDLVLIREDIQEIPPWVKGMSRSGVLRLYDCKNLVSLPQLSDNLEYIVADNCQSLERLGCSFNNREIHLIFPNCFNLNQEARDLIMHTSTDGYAIFSGTQVPACFIHRAISGDYLKIKLKESPLPTSLRFKACIMLVKVNEETSNDDSLTVVAIDIVDKQNDLEVLCTPSSRCINAPLTEHIYTFEVKAEEVTSTELVFEFTTLISNWKIAECGLLQILEVPSC
uniref:RPP1-EstC n=1 Tax=Arabidopsis thaliana TaxID=3702 RepID=A0A0S2RR90_ARATH|nr:RPP1-EstC [Arabidopsis thaliana]ALP31989.1 RPP1-EstG [Arabidopsis thaliana]ALP31991.1 RPP1-EstI [Arabidopsis thaliana]